MTYLSDRKRNKRKYWYYSIFFIVCASIIYFWPVFRTHIYPYTEGATVSYGETKGWFSNTFAQVYSYFSSRNSLLEKNKTLSLTIERLENQLADKDAHLKESIMLHESGTVHEESTLVMYPIMQDVTHVYSNIILSKGFRDGIVEHGLVYIRGRQAVCSITEVYNRTSLCTLFSASNQKVEGVTASSSLTLYLQGAGGGSYIAEVPRDSIIEIGDTIYLKSNQTMILGTIIDIARDDQLSSWYVYVRGVYNPLTSNVFYMNQ